MRRWLGQPGAGEHARQRREHIAYAIRQLKATPCRWPVGQHPGIREVTVEGYRIMYEVVPDTGDNETAGNVNILRVFGPGQDRGQF